MEGRFHTGDRISITGLHSQSGQSGRFVEYVTPSVARVELDKSSFSKSLWLAHVDYIQSEKQPEA
jgi:hypothetical protein